MLVLPGPGIMVIFLGLVVLSAEFQWAQRILAWFRERFTDLKHQAQSRRPAPTAAPPAAPDPRPPRPGRLAPASAGARRKVGWATITTRARMAVVASTPTARRAARRRREGGGEQDQRRGRGRGCWPRPRSRGW